MNTFDFAAQGIAVIPIYYKTKRPAVRWQQYQNELPTDADIARWFRSGRQINAAVVCGHRGLTVLDFDTMSAYVSWLSWATQHTGHTRQIALDTYRVLTSRGVHVYTFIEDVPKCGHFAGGDIKGRGGYVLIPPSVHPSGAVYEAVDSHAPILSTARLDDILPDPPEPPAPRIQPTTLVYPVSTLWPQSVLERVKEANPILSFFPDATATGGQRWYMAKCPWHVDNSPSLWIDTQRGLCGCYAGCTDKPLDSIGTHARIRGIDDKEAIRELADKL